MTVWPQKRKAERLLIVEIALDHSQINSVNVSSSMITGVSRRVSLERLIRRQTTIRDGAHAGHTLSDTFGDAHMAESSTRFGESRP